MLFSSILFALLVGSAKGATTTTEDPATPWILAADGESCDSACEIVGLKCYEEDLLLNNGDVDTKTELKLLLESLGAEPASGNIQWGASMDVPSLVTSDNTYLVSAIDRPIETFSCAYAQADRRRLCVCSDAKESHSDDNPMSKLGAMGNEELKAYCAGTCGQQLVDFMGGMLQCFPEPPEDFPALSDISFAIESMCSTNSNGLYCAHQFNVLEKIGDTITADECSGLSNMGCCLGSAFQTLKLSGAGALEQNVMETQLMDTCNLVVPKACPLPGQSVDTVSVDFSLDGLPANVTGTLSEEEVNHLKDVLATAVVNTTGVNRADVEIVFSEDENGNIKVTAVIVPSDTTLLDTIGQGVDVSVIDPSTVLDAMPESVRDGNSPNITIGTATTETKSETNSNPTLAAVTTTASPAVTTAGPSAGTTTGSSAVTTTGSSAGTTTASPAADDTVASGAFAPSSLSSSACIMTAAVAIALALA